MNRYVIIALAALAGWWTSAPKTDGAGAHPAREPTPEVVPAS